MPGWNPGLRHALVGTQFYDKPWSGCSLRHAWSGLSLRHALVGTKFYDMLWSGGSLTTCHSRYAVSRHVLVMTQIYDIHWSGRNFTICLVGTQVYGMPWSGRSFMTSPCRESSPTENKTISNE